MHHDLKLSRRFWDAKMRGDKPWELRSTLDRDFNEGDTVNFYEVDHPQEESPRVSRTYLITYVLRWSNSISHMLQPGACIFSHD